MIHPVILCGGCGARLWPASRKVFPKQFAPILGEESLYKAALRRFSAAEFAAPIIMTVEDFCFMAKDQATALGMSDAHIVIEPQPRDTAPSVLVAALMLAEHDPDALMLVAPSDHVISDQDAFLAAVETGRAAAEAGALVTFGVAPRWPETGYGYLEVSGPSEHAATPVTRFCEKPDLATAEGFVKAGNYLWNAGLFLGRARDIIAAFEAHAPDLITACRAAIGSGAPDVNFFRLHGESYGAAQAISFDYAIMEKAEQVAAVALECGWSDLGNWDALWKALDEDADGDADGVVTQGSVTALECRDSYLHAHDDTMQLVGLGLDGVIAVAMRDAVLVADKSRAQDVKAVVSTLRAAGVAQADDYPRFHRPWGWYETLCLGTRFQVKRIMVKPGGVLSLQSHHHRSEHWIVVGGTAEVTVGEEVKLVTENESVYIPLGAVHRMANPGKLPMYLIEVQTGAYLGEDDIVRYEDIYNRV